jgi:hypothetical protein
MSANAKTRKPPIREDAFMTIGELAGKVWRHLSAEGSLALSKLARELGENPNRVAMAVGWLAREGKVTLSAKGNGTRITLKENGVSW